jgi:hypothetical protein
MLLLKRYISNFACARYSHYSLYLEFSDFYVNQSLAGQTIPDLFHAFFLYNFISQRQGCCKILCMQLVYKSLFYAWDYYAHVYKLQSDQQ